MWMTPFSPTFCPFQPSAAESQLRCWCLYLVSSLGPESLLLTSRDDAVMRQDEAVASGETMAVALQRGRAETARGGVHPAGTLIVRGYDYMPQIS